MPSTAPRPGPGTAPPTDDLRAVWERTRASQVDLWRGRVDEHLPERLLAQLDDGPQDVPQGG